MGKRGPEPKLKSVDKFEMRLQREAGVSVKDVAAFAGVSVATAMRALAELRKKLGPERLKNGRRARAYLTHRELQHS